MNTLRMPLAAASLLVAVAACSGGGGAAAAVTPPPGTDLMITAKDVAFQQTTATAPAGKALALFFRNLDGAPHNVAIYTDSSASKSLFIGDRITDATTVYAVPALAAGSYFFRCDVHPNMTGTLSVGG